MVDFDKVSKFKPSKLLSLTQYPLPWLWSLTLLFCLRVLGQILVAVWQVPFLPPMAHWYSGLIPYPILLLTQLLILGLQAKINTNLARQSGFFRRPKLLVGKGLQYFCYIYAAVMVVRYVATMTLYPERRWLGEGTIPIVFHFVLSAYLWFCGCGYRYWRRP